MRRVRCAAKCEKIKSVNASNRNTLIHHNWSYVWYLIRPDWSTNRSMMREKQCNLELFVLIFFFALYLTPNKTVELRRNRTDTTHKLWRRLRRWPLTPNHLIAGALVQHAHGNSISQFHCKDIIHSAHLSTMNEISMNVQWHRFHYILYYFVFVSRQLLIDSEASLYEHFLRT